MGSLPSPILQESRTAGGAGQLGQFKNCSHRREEADLGAKNTTASLPWRLRVLPLFSNSRGGRWGVVGEKTLQNGPGRPRPRVWSVARRFGDEPSPPRSITLLERTLAASEKQLF